MAEHPKAGTPGTTQEDGGNPAGTPEPDPKDSAAGVADDKDARLTKLEADLKAERDLRLKHQDKVEAANKILDEWNARQGTKPPPTTGSPQGDPLSSITEDDIQVLLDLEKSTDPRERAIAKAQLANLRATVLTHDLTVKSNTEAAILRQPAEDQKAVREAWASGRFRSVDDAAENVKLSKLSPLQQENEALKKRLEEVTKQSGPAPAGTAPRGVGGGGGGSDGRKTMTDSEYARVQRDGSDKEKWDAIKAVRSGALKLVSD